MRWSMIALVALAFVANGCGGGTETVGVCTPGESEACSCTVDGVATPGERICREGGEEWTECHCAGDAPGADGETTPATDVSDPGSPEIPPAGRARRIHAGRAGVDRSAGDRCTAARGIPSSMARAEISR